ncbi:hypothetical protein Yalta_142 [Yalta virus]|nr:hypothetical protein Yalta_142 [Yalta virus]
MEHDKEYGVGDLITSYYARSLNNNLEFLDINTEEEKNLLLSYFYQKIDFKSYDQNIEKILQASTDRLNKDELEKKIELFFSNKIFPSVDKTQFIPPSHILSSSSITTNILRMFFKRILQQTILSFVYTTMKNKNFYIKSLDTEIFYDAYLNLRNSLQQYNKAFLNFYTGLVNKYDTTGDYIFPVYNLMDQNIYFSKVKYEDDVLTERSMPLNIDKKNQLDSLIQKNLTSSTSSIDMENTKTKTIKDNSHALKEYSHDPKDNSHAFKEYSHDIKDNSHKIYSKKDNSHDSKVISHDSKVNSHDPKDVCIVTRGYELCGKINKINNDSSSNTQKKSNIRLYVDSKTLSNKSNTLKSNTLKSNTLKSNTLKSNTSTDVNMVSRAGSQIDVDLNIQIVSSNINSNSLKDNSSLQGGGRFMKDDESILVKNQLDKMFESNVKHIYNKEEIKQLENLLENKKINSLIARKELKLSPGFNNVIQNILNKDISETDREKFFNEIFDVSDNRDLSKEELYEIYKNEPNKEGFIKYVVDKTMHQNISKDCNQSNLKVVALVDNIFSKILKEDYDHNTLNLQDDDIKFILMLETLNSIKSSSIGNSSNITVNLFKDVEKTRINKEEIKFN